jgi:hypothetical protein
LKFLKSDVLSQFLNYHENYFQALQMAVPQFSFEISEDSKVARTDVWRVGWMGSSENLQATEFIENSMPIVVHRVVHVHKTLIARFWHEKAPSH